MWPTTPSCCWSDGDNVYDAAAAAANELATIGSPGVIVLDDLHLAAPDPALLTAFTDALPDGFRCVAATRSDPPLSLARLRLRGDLLELRGNDLGFDPAEMSEFLAPYDLCLTDDELRRLHELTEGWPAGVQLAAIALQHGVEHEEFLQAFARTDRAISDFLVSEIPTGLPPDLVEFLVETSVLDIFDAELSADVTGIEDTEAVLDRLVAANLFVVPVDQRRRWHRYYHHQFGAFLRARLASSGTAKLRAAHERAFGPSPLRGPHRLMPGTTPSPSRSGSRSSANACKDGSSPPAPRPAGRSSAGSTGATQPGCTPA